MKFNLFGDPQPENLAELEILVENIDPDTVLVTISEGTSEVDPRFQGWSAFISGNNEDGEYIEVQTCSWPDKESLIADLHRLGYSDIEEE